MAQELFVRGMDGTLSADLNPDKAIEGGRFGTKVTESGRAAIVDVLGLNQSCQTYRLADLGFSLAERDAYGFGTPVQTGLSG